MQNTNTVMVSIDAFNSPDPQDLVNSNVDVVNAHFDGMLRKDELPQESLLSYYLDFYVVQMGNGGFSQFLYNAELKEYILYSVREALLIMGADKNLVLFEEGISLLAARYSTADKEAYLEDYYGDDGELSGYFNIIDDAFYELQKEENLDALNADWLRNLPNLLPLSEEKIAEQIHVKVAGIKNLAERQAEAEQARPTYHKAVLKLCAVAGQTLEQLTVFDEVDYLGEQKLGLFFVTDAGVFYMIEEGDKAIMLQDETDEYVCEIDLADL